MDWSTAFQINSNLESLLVDWMSKALRSSICELVSLEWSDFSYISREGVVSSEGFPFRDVGGRKDCDILDSGVSLDQGRTSPGGIG